MNKQALAAIKSGVQDLLDGVQALLAADDPTPAPVLPALYLRQAACRPLCKALSPGAGSRPGPG